MKADDFRITLGLNSDWLGCSRFAGRRATLNGAHLGLLDLSWADLTSALLAAANLELADLRGAKLANADLPSGCTSGGI
jgi:uncharacterized protein YjbI with pentapeptide repeats